LQQGQRESRFAIGHLADESSQRDQRDSYVALYFEDKSLPPNTPEIGERWLLLRPAMYHQIAEQPAQVTPSDVAQAIKELAEPGQLLRASAIYKYVKAGKHEHMDDGSFTASLAEAIKQPSAAYRTDADAVDTKVLPQTLEALLDGFVVVRTAPTPPIAVKGRSVSVKGKLASLSELARLYKNVLNLLDSQHPEELRLSIDASAKFKEDPGAGFDASLADGFDQAEFPGLVLTDSKKA